MAGVRPGLPVQVRVVIVGGGVAGLGAAARLSTAGFTDYVLLEARSTLGGRVRTVQHGDGVLDIGAQYIHGIKGNPVYDIASRLGHIVRATPDTESQAEDEGSQDNFHKINYFHMANGQRVDPAIVKEVYSVIEEKLEKCTEFSRKQMPNTAGHSVGSYLHTHFTRYLDDCGDSAAIRKMKEGVFTWWMLWENGDNACTSTYDLSLEAWGDYVQFEGTLQIELRHGFQPILNDIIRQVPAEKIKVGVEVKAIHWKRLEQQGQGQGQCQGQCQGPAEQGTGSTSLLRDRLNGGVGSGSFQTSCSIGGDAADVVLVTEDGAVIKAEHVIVTVPLGYLKAHAHTLFHPLLPNDKLRAIRRMGFGTVDKIYLQFPEAFWEKDCFGIRFAWIEGETFVLNCVDNSQYSEYLSHNWHQSVEGFNTVAGQPLVLEGWIAGEEAHIMESVPDRVVSDVCHELLQHFLGNPSIPKPTAITRTAWYTDAYTRGSYTHIKQDYTTADCSTLATPLPSKQVPRLLFAGEATHSTFFSTVHGALLTGQREADRLLRHLGLDSHSTLHSHHKHN